MRVLAAASWVLPAESLSRPLRMQLLGLQWVSSRLQCVLLEFCEAFNLRILTARQFATGMVSAAPHSMNVVALGGALGKFTRACAEHAPRDVATLHSLCRRIAVGQDCSRSA